MTPTPTQTSSRIELVDALRGFALLGIIIVHFIEQFYAGPPPPGHEQYSTLYPVDYVVDGITNILIRGKFFMLFSFLFGLSFSLQMVRTEGAGMDFRLRFAWRMVILMAIGLFHSMLYRGDILTIYAMLGLPLLFFKNIPTRWLILAAGLIMLGLPRIILMAIDPSHTMDTEMSLITPHEPTYWATVSGPSFIAVAWQNLTHGLNSKMIFQFGMASRGFQTFALFLLGLYAGKIHFFEQHQDKAGLYRKGLFWSLGIIAGLISISAIIFGVFKLHEKASPNIAMAVGMPLYDLFNLAQTALYIFAFLLLFRRDWWQRQFLKLAPIGRMALTTYVSQSVIGVILYFGFGFGLLGKIGATASVAIALCLFVAQRYFCRWWLSQYQYGPLEWLWRSATLLRWQSMKKV